MNRTNNGGTNSQLLLRAEDFIELKNLTITFLLNNIKRQMNLEKPQCFRLFNNYYLFTFPPIAIELQEASWAFDKTEIV